MTDSFAEYREISVTDEPLRQGDVLEAADPVERCGRGAEGDGFTREELDEWFGPRRHVIVPGEVWKNEPRHAGPASGTAALSSRSVSPRPSEANPFISPPKTC